MGRGPDGAQILTNFHLNSISICPKPLSPCPPSPEAQYPTAINQAFAATKWVEAHGAEINVDGSNLSVVGNSVGVNMAAVTALKAKEAGGPALRCQVLFWPMTDANFETESYNQYSEGYFLTKPMMKWFWDAYTTDTNQRKEIHASPLQATLEQLEGLPPALVQTAGNDVLRDEGEAYARKLDAAGDSARYRPVRDALHQAAEMKDFTDIVFVQSHNFPSLIFPSCESGMIFTLPE